MRGACDDDAPGLAVEFRWRERPALRGHGDRPRPGQVLAGEGTLLPRDLGRRARSDELPALGASERPEVGDVVGAADHLRVVLDHEDCVAQLAQGLERRDHAVIVAWMHADGGLIEDIQDAGEAGAKLPREAHALGFAAGERRRLPAEG